MEALILLFLLMATGRSRGGGGAPSETEYPAPTGPRALPTSTTAPPPWPQVVPPELPAFPAGWEYDEPPPAEVRARAWALLQPLWTKGSGSTSVEQTAGRWITYRAEVTKGNKRGVVAYRLKRPAAVPSPAKPRAPQQTAQNVPQQQPQASRSPGVPQGTKVSTQQPAAPAAPAPTLFQGAGKNALKHLAPWVIVVQQKLSVDTSDGGAGEFGPKTKAAVLALQGRQGWTGKALDGVVGPKTWAVLDRIATPAAA